MAQLLGVLAGAGIVIGGCLALGVETLGGGCVAAVYVGGSVGMAAGGIATGESPGDAVDEQFGITLRPDIQFFGGKSGENVKNLTGPPNSVVRGAEGRVYQTDGSGRVIRDITQERAQRVVPGQGFAKGKDIPTQEELDWIAKMWGKK
jgi:hypothetical protein